LRHREQVNRGHERRPLTNDEIVAKFRETIGRVAPDATADRVRSAVLSLGTPATSAAEFAEACRG
ncbi:MAG: MmgE/PrpD family protein, partial [Pseudonocardia sp.]|nr:MmgE/PrpD family protein [Pseudonocardia sp.]